MENEIIFEDYNIKFEEKDFQGVSTETLQKCKERLDAALSKLNQIREMEN